MKIKILAIALLLACAVSLPKSVHAQSCTDTNVTENFTGASTNCTWNFYGGACLTAGSSSATTSPGPLPMCVGLAYYGAQRQYGGNSNNLNVTPDTPITGGALRLTNNADNQSGAIVSNVPFSLQSAGLQVTFTTETYQGDSGGGNKDGADGMSFFLQDASNPAVTLGDYGGSLGYTCSNQNGSSPQGYDGMIGGYLGLGIDEYGNFLNGSTINASGVATYIGDNSSSGYGYVPNRVGLRGAGATAWSALSTNPLTSAYYPTTLTPTQQKAAVRQACMTGYAWDYSAVPVVGYAYATGNYLNSSGTNTTNGVPNPYGANPVTTVTLPNYAAIPNAWKLLSHNIANEAALYRGYTTPATTGANYGIPITYNLSISTSGLLSLSYSYNGGNFQPIITGQSITASNGALPASVRFGFAGSTGGSRNIHEIMCFQAQPQNSASSSAGLNQKQTAKVQTGTQVYFAFYNANNWTGALTSQYLDSPDGNPNDLQIDPAVNWDASCVLTGLAGGAYCAKTGQPNAPAPDPDAGRVMLTYNPSGTTPTGIPLTWSSTGATALSASQQANLDYGDPTPATSVFPQTANSRLEYLRGHRGDEQNAYGVDPNTPLVNPSGFRARTTLLGDIVDSSPTWVGPPNATFPTLWQDKLHTGVTMPENSGPSYASFITTYQSRTNVVYAGANDGFMHGFRSGFFDANGSYDGTTSTSGTFVGTNNDGAEVLAYMPSYVVNSINSSTTFSSTTGTTVPNPTNDFSSPLYAHKFNVDGTPGTGDVYYGGQWHSWLVSGLGAGGSSIFALDITNPGTPTLASSFTESNAASLVVGEWSSALTTTVTSTGSGTSTVYSTSVTGYTSNLVCANNSGCGGSLGKTFGTPQIRRFHNDPSITTGVSSWGAVFGNGSGSYNDDAGIYIMLASNTGGQPTFYYLSTGVGSRTGTPNAIYYVTAADMDGDHVIDYVYAGDLLGNLWRFDLTSSNPANWGVTQIGGVPTPIYTTPGGSTQPITTKVIVASIASTPNPKVLVEFGTGQQVPFSNTAPASYLGSQQYLIGVWDWNMSAWNALSTVKYDYLSSTTSPVAPTASGGVAPVAGTGQLLAQAISGTFDPNSAASSQSSQSSTAAYYRTVTSNPICWADATGCSGTGAQYGWYLPLQVGYANQYDANFPTTSTAINAQQVAEQVIFNPTLEDGAFLVNTTIPPTSSLATCSSTLAGGWTMAINPATGGAFTQSFFGNANHNFLNINNQAVSGIALSGTGSPSVVAAGTNVYVVTQTISGTGALSQINPPGGTQGSRLTWIEKR
jgi:type IV pilus assembly protein PilY1